MDHNGTPRRGLLHRTLQVATFGVLVTAGAVAHAQARPPLPTVATNANQESMARAITVLCPNLRQTYIATGGQMPGDQIELFDACAGTLRADSGDTSRSNALQELTGEELNAATSTTVDFSSLQRADIAARLVALRQATGSSTLARLSPDDRNLATIGTGGAAGDESSALGGRLGVFVNGRLGSGSKDTTDLEAGYDVDGTGVTVGADYRIDERFVIGAAFSYGSTETEFDKVKEGGLSGGTFDSDGYSLALFGGWNGERSYVDVIASFGKVDHDSKRRISYTLGFNAPDHHDLGRHRGRRDRERRPEPGRELRLQLRHGTVELRPDAGDQLPQGRRRRFRRNGSTRARAHLWRPGGRVPAIAGGAGRRLRRQHELGRALALCPHRVHQRAGERQPGHRRALLV